MQEDFNKNFLKNSDETGRHIVISNRTGRSYFVEPIDPNGRPADWGSYNPSTGQIENKKGAGKFTGSIHPKDSMLNEEMFKITITSVGESVQSVIERLDAQYPDKV